MHGIYQDQAFLHVAGFDGLLHFIGNVYQASALGNVEEKFFSIGFRR